MICTWCFLPKKEHHVGISIGLFLPLNREGNCQMLCSEKRSVPPVYRYSHHDVDLSIDFFPLIKILSVTIDPGRMEVVPQGPSTLTRDKRGSPRIIAWHSLGAEHIYTPLYTFPNVPDSASPFSWCHNVYATTDERQTYFNSKNILPDSFVKK